MDLGPDRQTSRLPEMHCLVLVVFLGAVLKKMMTMMMTMMRTMRMTMRMTMRIKKEPLIVKRGEMGKEKK